MTEWRFHLIAVPLLLLWAAAASFYALMIF